MGRRAVLAVVLALVGVACGGAAESRTPVATSPGGGVSIVDVIDDVAYYIGCANETVTVDGARWFPVPEWGSDTTADLYEEITVVERERPAGPIGFAPRVAPPGPGDDVGTLYVYADGVAWYESDSGQSIWLTRDEIAYDWVC